MWKWLSKTKGLKNDLLNFKDEPLSGVSIVLLVILDIFIFTNVIIGVEGETAKVPRLSYHFPSSCVKHFDQVQNSYSGFDTYSYGQSRAAHLRPHLNQYCKDLSTKIELFTLQDEFKNNYTLSKQIRDKKRQNKKRLSQISTQYNTRLFERIAQMQNNTELLNAKSEYDEIIVDNKVLEEELALIAPVSALQGYNEYIKYLKTNKEAFKAEKKSYKFWQPFKAYGHMLIFILPLLLFFGYFYRRTKIKQLALKDYNPIVKIISSHISLILFLPLFWFTLTLIYHVLPKTLLKQVIEFLVDIGLLSILNYVAILLVVLFFGGLIYWIQKRTLKRKQAVVYQKNYQKLVSWSQCFECEKKVDYTKPFCPFCGVGLHTTCPSCKKQINKHEPYCSYCSAEISKGV